MLTLITWSVRRSRFPLDGPGDELGTIDAPDRATAAQEATRRYGPHIVVERRSAKPEDAPPLALDPSPSDEELIADAIAMHVAEAEAWHRTGFSGRATKHERIVAMLRRVQEHGPR